jgi:hypothetical protein
LSHFPQDGNSGMQGDDRGVDFENSFTDGTAAKALFLKFFHLVIHPSPFRPYGQSNPAVAAVNDISQHSATCWVSKEKVAVIACEGWDKIFYKRFELGMKLNIR